MSRVSIKDIARVAGVSHSTVSRALANSPLISQETRERIEVLARQMGYAPDGVARSLVTGRTHTVGVVLTNIADPFVAEVVQGIENRALLNGYSVLVAGSGDEPERELLAVEMLRAKRVDGIIVTSSRIGALYRRQLERTDVPLVLINNHTQQAGPYTFSVGVENRGGGYLATQHLITLGHRRIAYVAAAAGHSDSQERLQGYRQALEEAGYPYDPRLVFVGNGRPDGGARAFAAMRHLDDPPTAVFCYNDMTAIGILKAARLEGVRVPEDLAVVGFDDIPQADLVAPTLTTVAQPKVEMGEKAMQMVLTLCDDPDGARRVESVVLEGHLVVRESSGGRWEGCTAANRPLSID